MLAFPVLFYAIGPFKKKVADFLLMIFILFVTALSAISIINFYISVQVPEQIAIGQSHIRFSLLICFSVLLLVHYGNKKEKWFKLCFIPVIAVLLFFLFILESFTGYVVILFLSVILPVLYKQRIKKKIFFSVIAAVLIIISALAFWGVYDVKNNCFPHIERVKYSSLDTSTINGNKYHHDTAAMLAENGNQVYLYVQEKEMIDAWNNRSTKKITDSSQFNPQTNILMRYLSSKNLRKDSVGVYSLSNQDIKNIEQGISNYKLSDFDPYRKRIYRFLWELNYYKVSGDPSGHSLTQRFEYWKAAINIIKNHPWIGVGTGDINVSFKNEYNFMNSKLKPEYRLRSHNQYLSVTVALGVAGLIIFIFTLLAPFVLYKIPDKKLYFGYIFIFLLSMLNEDTLETQVGVTFYALFNSFLLFILPSLKQIENEKE